MRIPLTSLQNQLLVATAELNGSPFERAVIFMAHHQAEGSMGFVINHPLKQVGFTDVLRSMGIEEMMAQTRSQPIVCRGGPVEVTRGFVLHSPDYRLQSTVNLTANFALSAQADIMTDIARGHGPQKLNFCLGYAGWSPGQLESELHGNSWIIAPATRELVFDTPPEQRYTAATHLLGLNVLNFHTETMGRA